MNYWRCHWNEQCTRRRVHALVFFDESESESAERVCAVRGYLVPSIIQRAVRHQQQQLCHKNNYSRSPAIKVDDLWPVRRAAQNHYLVLTAAVIASARASVFKLW